MTSVLPLVIVFAAAFVPWTSAQSIASTAVYVDSQCSGTPLVVSVIESVDCESEACNSFTATDGATYYRSTVCALANRESFVNDAFAGANYLLIEMYTKSCGLFIAANALLATGECRVYSGNGSNSVIAKINADGSANLAVFNGTACAGTPILSYSPDNESVSKHSCFKDFSVFYASTGGGSSSTGDTTEGATTTGSENGGPSVCGGVVTFALIGLLMLLL
ncbi:hypothetical protein PHYBOEH_002474 [Phytophthora boehmeriae]|uniref:Elicitin n=1 Tax=Phytophthora boehmeriae TaxID=109152 RepID=A0A8T1WWZ8_9STRA|nr:hypothetical protein PHYBOEH_002474 [Phytophthora boehmeriae]